MGIPTPEDFKEEQVAKRQDESLEAMKAELDAMTPKQRALAVEMIKNPGANDKDQIESAGYVVGPKSKPHHLKKKVAGKLGATLREFGIFEDDLAKVAKDCLHAVTITPVKINIRDAEGKIIREEIKLVETPNLPIQAMMFKTLCALGAYFPAKKIELEGKFTSGVFDDVDMKILEERKKDLENNHIKADYVVETPASE